MIEQLIRGFIEVWTPQVLLTLGISGLGSGMAAAWIVFPRPSHNRVIYWYPVHVVTMLTTITMVFWVGRIVNSLNDSDPFWGRVAAGFVLQMVFGLVVGSGVALGLKLRARRHDDQA